MKTIQNLPNVTIFYNLPMIFKQCPYYSYYSEISKQCLPCSQNAGTY